VQVGQPGTFNFGNGPAVSGSAPSIDADAQAWINAGANADSTRADNLVRALKAVAGPSSNMFADIKAAGGCIELFRGLNAGGATIPDLTLNKTATPSNSPSHAFATGYTLNGTNQSIDSGLTVVQSANYFAIMFLNHISFTSNEGMFSDADAATPALSVVQRTSTDNRFRTTLTKVAGTTSFRDSATGYSTGIDYQMGFSLNAQTMQPYSNVVSANSFTTDGTTAALVDDMRAANGTIKLGRSGSTYGNIQVHGFVAAPLSLTATQLQNLVDAIKVFWS